MNEITKAIILGFVQGLTEFLPVSSSGHLEIGKALLDVDLGADQSLLMTVILHGATALSTVVVFRHDIWEICRGLLRFQWNEEAQFATKIVTSMIPAAILGLAFREEIESLFSGSLLLVGAMLLVTGLLLFLAGRAIETERSVTYLDAAIIGISQAIAILPGVSRSGATISTSVLLGVDRTKAARFSFLMVVPLIFGKIAKDLLDGELTTQNVNLPALAAGFATALIVGMLACRWMIALVKNAQLWWFSIYCFLVGTIAILCGWWSA